MGAPLAQPPLHFPPAMIVLRRERQVSPRLALTREQLRELARSLNIPRGRNTADTIRNLRAAGAI